MRWTRQETVEQNPSTSNGKYSNIVWNTILETILICFVNRHWLPEILIIKIILQREV